ncbi:MAG: hypothetical protein EOO77_46670 [Oxalobacteraceae bacterium]|nr:MAG: hypothetical protein EOO77_46670 [Oxalobacteraceae bacterium]
MSILKTVFLLLLSTGYGMTDIQQPKPLDEALGTNLVKQVTGQSRDERNKALDTRVTATFGGKYQIASSRYFSVSTDVTWLAVSKNVQNQMLERSMNRGHYDKENPGILLIDFYPQPHGAFVLAMDANSGKQGHKLVGYFVLKQK